MATKNPVLSDINTPTEFPVASPVLAGALEGTEALARGMIEQRKSKILEGFRGQVSGIVNKAEEIALSQADQGFVGDFASRMTRIQQIAAQGGNESARTRAMLEAETALREAQSARPGLAAELRQEASLVLGADPTGFTLDYLSSAQDARRAEQEAAWDDYVTRSRELGIPRRLEGTDDGYAMFEALDEAQSRRTRYEGEVALRNTTNQYGEASDAYFELIENGSRSFSVIEGVSNSILGAVTDLSTQEQDLFRRGELTISAFGRDNMSLDQVVATLEGLKSEMGVRLENAGLGEYEYERASNTRDVITTHIDQTIATLQNTDQDAAAWESSLSLRRSIFVDDLPIDTQHMITMVDVGKEIFTLIGNSPFPSQNLEMMTLLRDSVVVPMQQIIGAGPSDGRSLNRAADSFMDRWMQGVEKYAGQENADELYLQDSIKGLLDLSNMVTDTTSLTPGLQEGIAFTLYSQLHTLNKIDNPSESVTQQWLEVFSNPTVLNALQTASPYIESELARELTLTFGEYASIPNNLASDISTFNIQLITPERGREAAPASGYMNINLSALEDSGSVSFEMLPVPSYRMAPNQMQRASNKAKEWSDKLTNIVRAQATFTMLQRNYSEPNYLEAYQDLMFGRTDFDFQVPNIPVRAP